MSSSASSRSRLVVSIVLYQPKMDELARTIGTLAAAAEDARFRQYLTDTVLVLVDHSRQALGLDERARLQGLAAGSIVDYVHDPANPGFGAGHNRAFALHGEKATFFLVANPDLEFESNSLVAGLSFLAEHPTVGVVAPALIENEGLRPACFRRPDWLTLFMRAAGFSHQQSRRLARYECRDWDVAQAQFNPPLMSGCCLLFRAGAFARLGGFDPRYFLYFEDFELSERARRLGISAYCPSMRVKHHGTRVARKDWRHKWWFVRSAWRFLRASRRAMQHESELVKNFVASGLRARRTARSDRDISMR